MHPIKLSNRQIQLTLENLRKTLKGCKTATNVLQLSIPMDVLTGKERPKVVFTDTAWNKMTALVDACNKEVAWHGIVNKDKSTYTIQDILIFPQSVTGATVTTDDTEYSMWLAEQPDEVFNNIRFHGHSHVNMGVSPSGVDDTYQQNILENVQDFYIFLIINKRGSMWCTIYDVEDNVAYDTHDIDVCCNAVDAKNWAKDAIKNFVKMPTVTKTKGKSTTPVTDSIMQDFRQSELRDFYYGRDY